jgi:uncharacterized membrane protein
MAPAAKNGRYEVRGVERLEAFSDGVFAIAITLLILEIKVPSLEATGANGLWRALVSHWSSYIAFALSFLIIGIMWANHHNIFRYVRGANHALTMFNLGLLFCVAFLPFPTAVLAEYLPTPDQTVAVVFYGGTLTVTAIFYNALWFYAASGRRLIKPDVDQGLVSGVTREYFAGPILYAVATGIAFVNVWISLAIHALLALLYVVPTQSRP